MKKTLLACLLACAGFASPAMAIMGHSVNTFSFSGQCSDCGLQPDGSFGAGNATGSITLLDLTWSPIDAPGGALAYNASYSSISNFTYTSDLLGTLQPAIADISQATFINSQPAFNGVIDYFNIQWSRGGVGYTFGGDRTQWVVQLNYPADIGVGGGQWVAEAVPEPETYAMLLAGLGIVGAIARRRKAKQA